MGLFHYLRYSNLKVSVDLNPLVWSFRFQRQAPTRSDPRLHIFYWRILPLSVILVVDDGTVTRDDPLDVETEPAGDQI